MFGWKFTGHCTAKNYESYGITLEYEHGGRATWLVARFGRHVWRFVQYHQETRITAPEDNEAVLWHFQHGPNRQPRGPAFHSGFAEAAAKGPVPDERSKRMRLALDEIRLQGPRPYDDCQ